MASFAIFNYQFSKIIPYHSGHSFSSNLRNEVEEKFQHRQEIFQNILDKDYYAKQTTDIITFFGQHNDKEYDHVHIIPPTENIVMMRIANVRKTKYVNGEFNEYHVNDYQNSVVIIDNGPGIQRILIENKIQAFKDVKQVARILENTFNMILESYHLKIELMHLQNSNDFWKYVEDRDSYPGGFYRVKFHLPHLNLKRLRKVYESVLNQSRESFDSDLEWSLKADEGGRINFNKKDKLQNTLISYMMEDVGSDNIFLYPNDNKRKAIVVGRDSFAAVTISEETIKQIEKEARSGVLFGSFAFDEIKKKTVTGIVNKKTNG